MNQYILCGRGNDKSLSQLVRALENVSANDGIILVPADIIIKEEGNEKDILETEG